MLEIEGLSRSITRPVLELSGGERQRVALAQCALQGAPLLLDDPVAFQDPAHQSRVACWLSSSLPRDQALVISAHDVNWVARTATHGLALQTSLTLGLDQPVADLQRQRRSLTSRYTK